MLTTWIVPNTWKNRLNCPELIGNTYQSGDVPAEADVREYVPSSTQKLKDELEATKLELANFKEAIHEMKIYLHSPKFFEDTNVNKNDILNRIMFLF